jgi:hypothetical protein
MEWVEWGIGSKKSEYNIFIVNFKMLVWGYLDDTGVVLRMTLIYLD